jgi:hypothetical protein
MHIIDGMREVHGIECSAGVKNQSIVLSRYLGMVLPYLMYEYKEVIKHFYLRSYKMCLNEDPHVCLFIFNSYSFLHIIRLISLNNQFDSYYLIRQMNCCMQLLYICSPAIIPCNCCSLN